jgi:chorismate synthase
LAVLADTGGAAIVAYEQTLGFNAAGWLGFVIGIGSRSGTLVSHMLGVRSDVRGRRDLGWHLKVLQGSEALRTGHRAAIWTFDPMRGANARLNLEKLGARAVELTIDKYGVLRSALYGEAIPTDRLTAHWDLLAPATAMRLHQVAGGRYSRLSVDAVADLPEATAASLAGLSASRPPRLRYRIPSDIDHLMSVDPQAAIAWRREMREALSAFLPTKTAILSDPAQGPLGVTAQEREGTYAITGFATGPDATRERASFYVFERLTSTVNEESA